MSKILLEPEVIESTAGYGRWMVVIFNNEINTVEDVMAVLMKATGCSEQEAFTETWEAHTFGKAPVHFADRVECEIVATMISTIGVKTQVRREWED
jgi:ATP-dependent Clp protease adapter protein ClpS